MGILKGKLVKKTNQKVMNDLEVQSYPWLDFKEKNLLFPDNPWKSVVLKKSHDIQELNNKVKEATQFQQQLQNKTKPLFPVDLTNDYEDAMADLAKRKRWQTMGEEEAMAYELADLQGRTAEFEAPSHPETVSHEHFRPTENAETSAVPPVETLHENQEQEHAAFTPEDKISHAEPQTINSDTLAQREKEGFDLGYAAGLAQGEAAGLLQGEKQGSESGYLEGFRTGEEKAMKAQESKYESVFRNVAQLVEQIDKLKNSLYAESKEVFMEIVKLCSEKILRQQLKLSDSALFSLFDEVIKTSLPQAVMKVELNPEDLERLKVHIEKLGMQDRVVLQADANKQSGDFTVESERGLSIMALEKTIEKFMESLHAELHADDVTPVQKAN